MHPLPTNSTPDSTHGMWGEHPVPHFRFNSLSHYPQLNHAVFTRHGGRSRAPYDTLNASDQVGDIYRHVTTNLGIIQDVFKAKYLLTMKQVHGTGVALIRSPDELDRGWTPSADAVITDVPGLAVLVKQADCQGVILFDPKRNVIAIIHCGWRGNVAGILSQVVVRMEGELRCDPSDLVACIGPSLGPCCAEFRDPTLFPKNFQEFRVNDTHWDLKAVSHHQLLKAGLEEENIHISAICTRCRTDLFYSYRGEGTTGRFATVAMLNQGG